MDIFIISDFSLLKIMHVEIYNNFFRLCLEKLSGQQVETRTCPGQPRDKAGTSLAF